MRKKNLFLFSFGILSSFLISQSLWAGTKTIGSGLFHAAYTSEASGAGFNSALLFDIPNSADGNFGFIQQDGRLIVRNSTIPGFNGNFSSTTLKFWPYSNFGYCKLIKPNLAVGAVIRPLGTFAKATFTKPVPLYGTTRLGHESISSSLQIIGAYRLNQNHIFAAGISFVIARLKFNGVENRKLNSIHPSHCTNKGYDYARGMAPILGYKFNYKCFSFGIGYIFHTPLSRFKKYSGLIAQHGKNNLFATWEIGVAWKGLLENRLVVMLDTEILVLKNSRAGHDSPFLPTKQGTSHGPGRGNVNKCSISTSFEYALAQHWTVRAGYVYIFTPLKRRYTAANFFLGVYTGAHNFSSGATYAFGQHDEYDFSFALSYQARNFFRGKPLPAKFGPAAGTTVDLVYEGLAFSIGLGHKF